MDSFDSIDQMLDADTLGGLLNDNIGEVTRSPMHTEGLTENPMERVTCARVDSPDLRFVLKTFDPDDWVNRLSHDDRLREIVFLEQGWYAELPEPCAVPAVAASRGSGDAALLMWDVSDSLFPQGDSLITDAALEACIRAITALHAGYWRDGTAISQHPDLCSVWDWIDLLSPSTGRDRAKLGVDNDVTAILEDGWEVFADAASPLAAQTVSNIHTNPDGLMRALESEPGTLIHGDTKLANLGVDTLTGGVMMFDWGLASFAPALLELGWFLAVNSARLPVPKETVIDTYRTMLDAHGVDIGSDWERSLDLGLLGGGTLRLGWAKALGTLSDNQGVQRNERAEVDWWSEATERASRWID